MLKSKFVKMAASAKQKTLKSHFNEKNFYLPLRDLINWNFIKFWALEQFYLVKEIIFANFFLNFKSAIVKVPFHRFLC